MTVIQPSVNIYTFPFFLIQKGTPYISSVNREYLEINSDLRRKRKKKKDPIICCDLQDKFDEINQLLLENPANIFKSKT